MKPADKTRTLTEAAAVEVTIRLAKIISMLDYLLGQSPDRTPEISEASILHWTGCADGAEFNALVRTEAGLRRVLLNFGRAIVAELGPAQPPRTS